MECLLWLVVVVMAGLIVSVNFILLETTHTHTHTIAEESAETVAVATRRRKKRMKIPDPPAKRTKVENKVNTTNDSSVLLQQQQQQQQHLPHHHVKLSPAKDPTPKRDKTSDELGPLLKILRHASVADTPELRERLPTWQQVVDRYGAQPVVLGLETCAEFKSKVPLKQRTLAPAGPFNSGTNLLFEVLLKNCQVPGAPKQRAGVQWQVNWGKHQPPRFRFENFVRGEFNNSNYMPIVPVRDPYTWMQSMCRNRYAANWLHAPEHCPNFIPNHVEDYYHDKSRDFLRREFNGNGRYVHNVLQKAQYRQGISQTIPVEVHYKSDTINHTSLVDMWKDWYQEYYDSPLPRLMIRLEDLVFHPGQVLKQVCECVGGVFVGFDKMELQGESPKKGQEKTHGKNPTNLADAMVHHVFANRTNGMTVDDIKFAKYTLMGDDSLMDEFGYHPPF
jgi:hypothetical protein